MSASKRPSTSSLRRFITSRPFVTVAELRRRFGLDDPDAMALLSRNGTVAWIGLPDREATKLQDLWDRNELGVEMSVEVHAPVVVGVYPMRIARYVMGGNVGSNGIGRSQPAAVGEPAALAEPGTAPDVTSTWSGNGHAFGRPAQGAGDSAPSAAERAHPHAPRPMSGAPSYGSAAGRPLNAPGEMPRG
jgi:hypothetical protein